MDRLLISVAAVDPRAGESVGRAARLCADAVCVQVTGRAGVGKSALVAALGAIAGADFEQTRSWDVPGADDPDLTAEVVVLVILDPPRGVDLTARRSGPASPVVVLNKADTLSDPAAAAARCAGEIGSPCLPVSAAAEVAGLDAVRAAVVARVRTVRAARSAALLAELREWAGFAALRDPIEAYLAADAGVRLAVAATGAAEPVGDGPQRALRRAVDWRERMAAGLDPAGQRAALALQRAAVRAWARHD